MSSSALPRILFLHGFTQSGNTLRHKTGAISKALAKHAEIKYPTGPIQLEMPDPQDPEERERLAKLGNEAGEGSYAWWKANDETQDLDGLDLTMASLKEVLEKEGPFDGVMGFSQGGGCAAMLVSLLERQNPLIETSHPPFKFAVIFSGFRSRFPRHDWMYDPMIKTPMLHVIGNADPIVTPERSSLLIDVCVNNETLYHPGSHFVPSAAPFKAKIVDFIVDKLRPVRGMTCIVAATESMGIGNKGGLPWKLKKEMKYFADVTSKAPEEKKNVVIMGRHSWESIPEKFRPLKGRINIVVTSNQNMELSGPARSQQTCLATSLDDALIQVHKNFADTAHKVFVIGGAQLYKSALAHPDTERILFTAIKGDFECDTVFPVDFRSDSADWKQRPFEQLWAWTSVDCAERNSESDVNWEYEMWEKTRATKL